MGEFNFDKEILYAVPFWNMSVPAFVSFNLYHYGYISDITEFISISREENKNDNHVQAFQKWLDNGEATINIAYSEMPFAESVEEIGRGSFAHDNVSWTFMNIWDCPYNLKADRIDRDVRWICHQGNYLRIAKYIITEISFENIIRKVYEPISSCWGNDNVIIFEHDETEQHENAYITFYMAERSFETKEECLADMENSVFEPDTDMKTFCSEIFADG